MDRSTTIIRYIVIVICCTLVCMQNMTAGLRNEWVRDEEAKSQSKTIGKPWGAKGLLWNDTLTNGEPFSFTILIKNNGKKPIMAPLRFNALACTADIRGAEMIGLHQDGEGSPANAYVCLLRDEVHAYTYTVVLKSDAKDDTEIRKMTISLHNNLSQEDKDQLASSGYAYIENVSFEFHNIPFKMR